MGALDGLVAVVTGGSRGVGKGVTLGLGEAGATVYITGRTQQATSADLPGTIAETAAAVTRLGGMGIAVRCDHRDDTQVAALFQRVREEHGRLDLLVNNAFAQPASMTYGGTPFWELPLSLWDDLHAVGPRSAYVASWYAVPLMLPQSRGLIVNISSGGAVRYLFNLPYGVAKAGLHRLTEDMAHELRSHGVAAVSLWPGMVKTEFVLAQPRFAALAATAERPQFTGRAVAALAADPEILTKSGQALDVRALAVAYGFTDVDGSLPPTRHARGVAPAP